MTLSLLIVLGAIVVTVAIAWRVLRLAVLFGIVVFSLIALVVSAALGFLPLPKGSELESATGLKAPGFVWGASVGWGDYNAFFTFYADPTWVRSAVASERLQAGAEMQTQAYCLSGGEPWWIKRHEKDRGSCWFRREVRRSAGDLSLFYVEETGRVTVQKNID